VRTLLVSLNRVRFPYPVYPIGLDYVAAAIAPAHESRILDLCPLDDAAVGPAIHAAIRDFAPGAVGVSIRNVDNLEATNLCAFVEDMRSVVGEIRSATAAPIVLGGAGFTIYPSELLGALGADFGVVGEGERSLALFDAIEAGRGVTGLPGVAVAGVPPPLAAPLGPDFTPRRAPVTHNPALGFYLTHGGIVGIQTQRGCSLRCIYCTYPGIEGRTRRTFPPEAVAREAKQLEAAGARYLFLTDSVFNGDPAHCLAVADQFRRFRLGIPWGAFFAPVSPPGGFYESMAAAGCTHVEFGTESLSDTILPRFGKPFRFEDVIDAHRSARSAGLHVAHFMIPGGPGETLETLNETLDRCDQIAGSAIFFFCGMRICPGTDLERLALATGQIGPGESLLEPRFYEPPDLALRTIADRVQERAAGRGSWIVGAGADRAAALLTRLYDRGSTGPLWERLVDA
jgi:radical SAM superfamily enzyme YgiQ (UPF0313 family)